MHFSHHIHLNKVIRVNALMTNLDLSHEDSLINTRILFSGMRPGKFCITYFKEEYSQCILRYSSV